MSVKQKREAKPARPNRKITFANAVIGICLTVSLCITAAVVYEYHRLGAVMPAGVVTALLGLWGGELLIIALRQVFGSDVIHKQSTGSTDVNENGSI